MGMSSGARGMAVAMVLALVAGACSSGENPIESLDGTNTAGLDSQLEIPDPVELVIDEDPDSPVAASVFFEEGDHLVERLDFLGPKPSTNLPPTSALVYMKDSDDVFRIDLDVDGRPSVMYLGDVGELQFTYAGTTLTATFVAPDGSSSTESFPLTGDGDVQSMEPLTGGQDATGVRAVFRSAAVDVHRAVFVDVNVWAPDGELPDNFSAPFLQTGACHTTRSSVTFECGRVGAHVVESRGDLRVYRLAMTHAASAVVDGLDPSIWPSAQACEAALGSHWWIESPLAVPGTAVSVAGIGTAIFSTLLTGSGQVAIASAAASQAFLSAAAIAGTAAISFSFGNWVGEQLKAGGEGTCERITRRVAAADMLGATIGDIAFTVEVCLPPIKGWAAEPECQDVGPYQPFSSATLTTPGDAGSLDRNRLASVDFVVTSAPGSITGTVVDAESGDPIPGAVVTGAPDGSHAVTDEAGEFTLVEVPVGVHTITVTAEGFSEGSKPIEVESQQIAQATFAMEPGAESLDGVYTLDVSAAWLDIDVSGKVLQSEMRLEVIDDAVAAFDYVFVHTDLASVTGSKGVVLCRADATLKMAATYPASFTDGLALIPVLYEASQTAGRPTEDGSADDCDDASMLSAPLEAQVSAGTEGVMTVQILNGGSPLGAPIELNR